MNKAVLALTIFACCLTSTVLSSNMREGEAQERELTSINLGGLIGSLLGNKNITIPISSNSTITIPVTNNTSTPVNNTTSPINNTSSTPVNNTTSAPVNNTTSPINNTSSTPVNNTTSAPVQNTTSPTNSTTTSPVVNNTQPADSDSGDSDADSPPTNSTNSSNTTTPAPAPVKYAKNDVNMATLPEICLTIHNQERMAVGVANLTWSDSLAASAQAWAENMAVNGFRHSGKTGENIASSTYSTKTLTRLLGLWTKEKSHYIPGCSYGKCSSTSAEVGHYTQMVWAKTTQVGCGFAPGVNKGYNYLCCQYYKAGNIIGQQVYPYTAPTNSTN